MRSTLRRLRGRHHRVVRPVTVRAKRPWYWRFLLLGIPLLLGYAAAYWHFSGRIAAQFGATPSELRDENRTLSTQLGLAQRALQIERATASNLAQEMAAQQDEILRLKEEVAFYKDILDESGVSGVPQIHSVKLTKGARAGEYHYQILLVQGGRHDKMITGSVRLMLHGARNGQSQLQNVAGDGIKPISFRYYHRIEGSFSLTPDAQGRTLVVEFTEQGKKQPAITRAIELPH